MAERQDGSAGDPEGQELALSVIVPARNEEDAIGACLTSLVAQSEPGWELGRDWEILVVDDASTDRTRALAEGFAGVRVLEAPALDTSAQSGFTGKTNACWAGAQAARGKVLVFTDADTIHERGDLSRARHEMEKYGVALLSYSPRQLTTGAVQRVVMPLVFAELAIGYPMKRVNVPEDRTAAANGQFLMVDAEEYFALGGHRAVGREVLEDVALARTFKRARKGLRFRYAPDALSTRMYRTTAAMMEGWTKNLGLLFPRPLSMASLRLLDLLLLVVIPWVALRWYFPTNLPRVLLGIVWLRVMWRFYARVAQSNFSPLDCALSILGLPLFVYLLVRSAVQVRWVKRVAWKGRSYRTGG